MDLSLPQFFARIGSKARLKEKIYNKMPKDFKTYVEPYFGSGAVMFGYKFNENQKVIINDLDRELMEKYRIIKSGLNITPEILKKYDNTSLEQKTRMLKKSPSSNLQKIVNYLIKFNTTFGSTGKGLPQPSKNINLATKLKRLPDFTKKLKKVTILSQGAITVINKYNNKDTFLYLDPPYEESEDLYKKGSMDFEKLASTLRNFKGKFLLSLNDSKNIRNIFKDFKIRTSPILSSSVAGENKNIRKELFITNY